MSVDLGAEQISASATVNESMLDTAIVLTIVVPVYNEAEVIVASLQPLQILRGHGVEIILADGGCNDTTQALAAPLCDHYLHSESGRARQMNTAAAQARGQYLLFLHADTLLPPGFHKQFFARSPSVSRWGFFPVRLSGQHWLLRWVERGMNLRSAVTRVATGDQAMWVERSAWQKLGGFKSIALMEDIELSKRLRQIAKPSVYPAPLITSSRRWETQGVVTTILLMWRLRLLYFIGVKPDVLASHYRIQNPPA